jgi:YVTN family beta-propeller protein
MNRTHRAIFLTTVAASLWAQAPPMDPMFNRIKDPPDVYTIGTVNDTKTLFRIAFFPYDNRFDVYQVPILLQPVKNSVKGRATTANGLVGPFDNDNFPPDLPPLTSFSPTPQTELQTRDAAPPPDSEDFLVNPWELPDPVDDFPSRQPPPFGDPFAQLHQPPQFPGDQIPWVDLTDGALEITNSAQPIGYVAAPSETKPHVTIAKATSIFIGAFPAGVVLSRDLSTAYVAVTNAAQVAVIDLIANKLKPAISINGSVPYAIAITPDGKTLYVADAVPFGGLYSIDIPSGTVKQLPVGVFYVTSLALTPDGSRLWICNNKADVSVMDVLTDTLVAHLPVDSPFAVAFNHTGTRAYISSADRANPNGTVEVYDANSYVNLASIPVGYLPHAVAVTPSGRHVFVVNSSASGSVMQISTATNSVIRTFPVGASPSGLGMER